jgi:hypothetical protein
MCWRCGSSDRVPALKVQSPKFKSQSQKKKKKQQLIFKYATEIHFSRHFVNKFLKMVDVIFLPSFLPPSLLPSFPPFLPSFLCVFFFFFFPLLPPTPRLGLGMLISYCQEFICVTQSLLLQPSPFINEQ